MAVDMEAVEDSKIWEELAGDASPLSWFVVGQKAGSNEMEVKARGDGDLDELKAALKPDQLLQGAFRVDGVDERGGVTSRRCKLIAFNWAGPDVPGMVRARSRGNVTAVLKYMSGHHIKMELEALDELSESLVIDELLRVGGAHKPARYEFGSAGRVAAGGTHGVSGGKKAADKPERKDSASSGELELPKEGAAAGAGEEAAATTTD
mmetsp:Transcript_79334/g.220621  ORF Transcript_79334/g.220621 Transcript_79334/m.220621 type:complete len:207 (+) Transcript_79334:38-658(+)